MKRLMGSTAVAAVFVLFGIASSAYAATVSISSQTFPGSTEAPIFLPILADFSTPTYISSTTGSVTNIQLSPYAFNSTVAEQASPYSILSPGGFSTPSSATYTISGAGSFTILWGSPDSYNTVAFYTSTDGTGAAVGSFVGSGLACYGTTCHQTTWDLVAFSLSGIGSVKLSDDGTAAFEYGLAPINRAGTTPLPAAVWLFGSVIAGAAGMSRMRRQRKVAA